MDDSCRCFKCGSSNTKQAYILLDMKTWGSFPVAKFLGLVKTKVDDPTGALYEKSGNWGKAGTVKQIPMWTPNPLVADKENVTLQLNAYRRLAERAGLVIADMRLQVTVRDGDTVTARGRGIFENMYVFDVARMDDAEVDDYFSLKGDALAQAIATGVVDLCSPEERWQNEQGVNVRCQRYCDVAGYCDMGRRV